MLPRKLKDHLAILACAVLVAFNAQTIWGQQENSGSSNQNSANAQAAQSQNPADQATKNDQQKNQDKQKQDKDKQKQNKDKQKDKPSTDLGVFELKHISPQDMINILALNFYRLEADEPGSLVATRAFQSVANNKILISMIEHGEQINADDDPYANYQPLHMAVEGETFFVRGPANRLEEVGKLIEKFDIPADQLKTQQVGQMMLIPLNADDSQRTVRVLNELGLTHQMSTIGDRDVMVVPVAQESELKQIRQVLARLGQDQGDKANENEDESANEQDTAVDTR